MIERAISGVYLDAGASIQPVYALAGQRGNADHEQQRHHHDGRRRHEAFHVKHSFTVPRNRWRQALCKRPAAYDGFLMKPHARIHPGSHASFIAGLALVCWAARRVNQPAGRASDPVQIQGQRHRHMVRGLRPAAGLAQNLVAAQGRFQIRRHPYMIQPAAAVGGVPIAVAIGPPGI